MAELIAFAGRPGTGKSTIAQALSAETGALYLRVDEIDAVLWAHDPERDIGPLSYHIAAGLAASNLQLGHDVITDCVNPWPITREMFTAAAQRGKARLLGVEIVCSSPELHRARVEHRTGDVPGLSLPDWNKVKTRSYTPWTQADLQIDTAQYDVRTAVHLIRTAMTDFSCNQP